MAPHSDHGSDSNGFEHHDIEEIPVLIIGGGPAGLLQAFLLSQLNVKSLIIERYPTRLDAPKAHALSPRSLELCRQFGIDVNEIRKLGTNREDAYWVNFITSLTGHYVGSLPYERMDVEVLADTPTMIHNIPQPTFEELIAARLTKDTSVQIRKNHSFIGCVQNGDSVTTTIENRNTNATYKIRSRHVIGCDGAKSKVREYLGVESEGESSYETMMTIHFNADLRRVVGKQVGMLHWVMDPEVSGFIIGYDLGGNQVLICNFDSKKHPINNWNEELCRKTVTAAIGKSIPFEVLSHRPWILSRKVANSYRVGNIFLAGDAAHSFPPTGGLGLNSGLADVHNLAYKIAAVHQGWGTSSLLDTYQFDRRQVALVNSQQSVKNGQKIFGLLKTLGTADSEGDIAKAKSNLFATITDPKTRSGVLKGIEGQREHFDNLGLHIGYVYGDLEIPQSASLYTPSYRPGARLPHAWIKFPSNPSPDSQTRLPKLPPIDSSYVGELTLEELTAKRYSTLDLCAVDAFTLIVDTSSAHMWTSIIVEVRSKLPKSAIALKINIAALDTDFELVPGSRGLEWLMGMQLGRSAAVLVRPDQHILDTFRKGTTAEQVYRSLSQHLGV